MMLDYLSGAAVVLSLVSLGVSLMQRSKLKSEALDAHAARAVAYAEQMGGTRAEKLRHALEASIRFDRDANGRQDWTDAQHRIAVEAAVQKLKTPLSTGVKA